MGAQFQVNSPEALERKNHQGDRGRVFAYGAEGAGKHLAQSEGQSPTSPQALGGSVLSELTNCSALSAKRCSHFALPQAKSAPTQATEPSVAPAG